MTEKKYFGGADLAMITTCLLWGLGAVVVKNATRCDKAKRGESATHRRHSGFLCLTGYGCRRFS